ncbi:MAG: nuclear transport factor 2 family protein [Gemmatimonadota bacterium]
MDTSRSHSVAADSAAVATTVSAFRRALQVGDSSAAIELLAPDVSVLESGDIETLAEYRSHHLSADIAFARAVRSVSGPLRIVISGDVAWVTSTSTTQGEYRGRRIDSVGAELMILSRSNGRWKIRVIHWSSHARAPRP